MSIRVKVKTSLKRALKASLTAYIRDLGNACTSHPTQARAVADAAAAQVASAIERDPWMRRSVVVPHPILAVAGDKKIPEEVVASPERLRKAERNLQRRNKVTIR